jgi:hypothetical protein
VAQEDGGGKDSDYEFNPPDFDEDAFIHREMVSFRTTLILFVWGIVAAAASWAAFAAMHGARTGWLVGLVLVAVFGYALRWLFPRLGADIAHFKRREWLGTAALFFFTWLAFFILAINPPLSDFAPPRVELHASPLLQEADDTVTVHLFVEDNVRVAAHTFALTQDGRPVVAPAPAEVAPGHFRLDLSGLAPGVYHLAASARDARGHAAETALDFAVTERILHVDLPANGTLATRADQVLVTAQAGASCDLKDAAARATCFQPCTTRKNVINNAPCVRTVRLLLGNGNGNAIDLEYDGGLGGWKATSNFAGWSEGDNSATVVLEMVPTFAGSAKVGGGNVTAGPYTLRVVGPAGTYAPKVVAEPLPHQRNVPGPGLPALAAGLAAVALLARRRGLSGPARI